MKSVRIGSGAGYAGDRIEPAIELMEHGDLDYIILNAWLKEQFPSLKKENNGIRIMDIMIYLNIGLIKSLMF